MNQFTGSEHWYRFGIVPDITCTDGAKYVADTAGAYWLLDENPDCAALREVRRRRPWVYSYSPYSSQENEEIPAFEVHGAEKVCDTNENRPYSEQEANARLIAAALPMLSLLKRINDAFTSRARARRSLTR